MKSRVEFTVSGYFSDPRMNDPIDSAPELWVISWVFGSTMASIDGSMCANLDSVDVNIPQNCGADDVCKTLEGILVDYVREWSLAPC